MSERGLQLALEAGQSLPIHLCWRVNDGYLRATGRTELAEIFTLGIWGPGEIVMPELFSQQPVELRALSAATVHEWNPDPIERQSCSAIQIRQMGMLLQITRIRPVEARLFNLLAEMASVSRVTVTKALGHFRQLGLLERVGEVEVLNNAGISLLHGAD